MESSRIEENPTGIRDCFSVRTALTPLKYQNFSVLTKLNIANSHPVHDNDSVVVVVDVVVVVVVVVVT